MVRVEASCPSPANNFLWSLSARSIGCPAVRARGSSINAESVVALRIIVARLTVSPFASKVRVTFPLGSSKLAVQSPCSFFSIAAVKKSLRAVLACRV